MAASTATCDCDGGVGVAVVVVVVSGKAEKTFALLQNLVRMLSLIGLKSRAPLN